MCTLLLSCDSVPYLPSSGSDLVLCSITLTYDDHSRYFIAAPISDYPPDKVPPDEIGICPYICLEVQI